MDEKRKSQWRLRFPLRTLFTITAILGGLTAIVANLKPHPRYYFLVYDGMEQDHVRGLLGRPNRIIGGEGEDWTYSDPAFCVHVAFDTDLRVNQCVKIDN